jgi:hypothetical protein
MGTGFACKAPGNQHTWPLQAQWTHWILPYLKIYVTLRQLKRSTSRSLITSQLFSILGDEKDPPKATTRIFTHWEKFAGVLEIKLPPWPSLSSTPALLDDAVAIFETALNTTPHYCHEQLVK